MKTIKISIIILLSIAVASCTSKQEKIEKIKTLEKEVYSDSKGMNKEKAAELIKLCTDYADNNKGDTLAPACLYKAAVLQMNLKNGDEAIKFFDRIIAEYPDYTKTSEACFLKGFVYETLFQNLTKARETYSEFLIKYPKSDYADDAQASLNNLGKTPEQILKEAQDRAVQDSLAKK